MAAAVRPALAGRLFIRRSSRYFPYNKLQNRCRLFGAITPKEYSNGKGSSSGGGGSGSGDSNNKNLPSYDSHFIGGKWATPTSGNVGKIDVIDSNTGQVVSSVPSGTEEDTILAIKAAKEAFPVWKHVPLSKRVELIRVFLSKFEARRDDIVERLTVELGCTTKFARQVQFGASVANIKTFLRVLESSGNGTTTNNKGNNHFEFEFSAGRCTVVKEPVGVVGAITPWNYPTLQMVLKVVPALLAGCPVVLKPSEVTPLCSYSVAEAFDEAIKELRSDGGDDDNIPSGIFNMVMGYGPDCGQILASHPDVNLVSFTGSTRGGQILTEVASKSMKPIVTELGGKSACIILDDADYGSVVPKFVKQMTGNSGQTCDALSRMLVPRNDYEAVVGIAKTVFEEERVGTSTNPNATMGPLASKQHYDRVQSFLEKGVEEGARVVVGGPGRPTDSSLPEHGYFVNPTLFADVSNDMTIAREEIFGPVLSMIPYDTEEDAVRIANDTIYGLNNAVASRDESRALRIASQLESGTVMVNSADVDTRAPFGGIKMSGNGRECGAAGLEEFLVTKTINIPIDKYRSAIAKISGAGQVRNMSTTGFLGPPQSNVSRRSFSTITPSIEPILDMDLLDERLNSLRVEEIARKLSEEGYYATTNFLSAVETKAMRQQSIALWDDARYEQSWSESIDEQGVARRFDKEGVFACEPDGADYETAPDLLVWMSWLLQTLPPRLNFAMDANGSGSVDLSSQAFNAKLAVTKPGGSTYPLHVDNPQGLAVNDTRKLTAIIYLNDEYEEGDGGELRIHLNDNVVKDLAPTGGSLLLFWSDLIPHEVLPTSPNSDRNDEKKDRYALTIWIPTTERSQIHPPASKFSRLRSSAFQHQQRRSFSSSSSFDGHNDEDSITEEEIVTGTRAIGSTTVKKTAREQNTGTVDGGCKDEKERAVLETFLDVSEKVNPIIKKNKKKKDRKKKKKKDDLGSIEEDDLLESSGSAMDATQSTTIEPLFRPQDRPRKYIPFDVMDISGNSMGGSSSMSTITEANHDTQIDLRGDDHGVIDPGRAVFADNLPIDISTQQINEAFQRCGPIDKITIFNARPDIDPGPLTQKQLQLQRSKKLKRNTSVGKTSSQQRPRTPVYALLEFKTEEGARRATSDPLRIFGLVWDRHAIRSYRPNEMTMLYLEDIPAFSLPFPTTTRLSSEEDCGEEDEMDMSQSGISSLAYEDLSSLEFDLSRLLKAGDLYVSLEADLRSKSTIRAQKRRNRQRGRKRGPPRQDDYHNVELNFPSFEAAYWSYQRLSKEFNVLTAASTAPNASAREGDYDNGDDFDLSIPLKPTLQWMRTPRDAEYYWTREFGF